MNKTTPDFSHCFRKQFTKAIYDRLVKGESINLTGKRNNGQRRLLDDIKQLGEQEGIHTVIVDVNSCKYSFEGFLNIVDEQLSSNTTNRPATTLKALPSGSNEERTSPVSLSSISQRFNPENSTYDKHFLLLLNYDAILDNSNQRFPKSFFDNLNSLKNKSNVSLCCVTDRPHLNYKIHYKDEVGSIVTTTSWLDLNIIELEKPTTSEIREELNNELSSSLSWQEEEQKEIFIDAIRDNQSGYAFTRIIINSFSMNNKMLDADKRLTICYNQYRDSYGKRPKKSSLLSLQNVKSFIDYIVDNISKIMGKK